MTVQDGFRSESDVHGRNFPWIHLLLTVAVVAVFAYALWSPYRLDWPTTTRMFPVAVSWVGLMGSMAILAGQIGAIIAHMRRTGGRTLPALGPLGPPLLPVLRHWAWMIAYVMLLRQVGFLPATFIFIVLYVLIEARRRLATGLIYASTVIASMMMLFGTVFGLVWPRGRYNGAQQALLELFWRLGG